MHQPGSLYITFFLGGQDLEMGAIKGLLLDHGFREGETLFDRGLAWHSARLSAYQDLLGQPGPLYGIELYEDIAPPPSYHRIDHHNALAHLPSSLEQVAALLGHTLSWEEQLIAANDRGYIPAMQALGASMEEIAQIRRLDREAQGVTEVEEAQALADIARRQQRGPLTVVETILSRFSPITDALYGTPHLLIHSPRELTYYGPGRDILARHYAAEVTAGRAYYGGASDGFLGLAAGKWTPAELDTQRRHIIHLISQSFS